MLSHPYLSKTSEYAIYLYIRPIIIILKGIIMFDYTKEYMDL